MFKGWIHRNDQVSLKILVDKSAGFGLIEDNQFGQRRGSSFFQEVKERRRSMKKKMLVPIGVILFSLFLINGTAGAASVRFPVEVSINASARYLTDTEIFVINLRSTPVTISFGYYNNGGIKGSCPIPPRRRLRVMTPGPSGSGGVLPLLSRCRPLIWLALGRFRRPQSLSAFTGGSMTYPETRTS